jgi:hypothetical protein
MAKCKLIERKKSLINRVSNKLKINLNVLGEIIDKKFFNNKNIINEEKDSRNKYGFPITK